MTGQMLFKENSPESKKAAADYHRKWRVMKECPECGTQFEDDDSTEILVPEKEEAAP